MKKNNHHLIVQAGERKRYGLGLIPRFAGLTVFIAVLAGSVTGTLLIANMRGVLKAHILDTSESSVRLASAFAAEYMNNAQSSLLHLSSRNTFKNAVFTGNRAAAEDIMAEYMEITNNFDNVAVYTAGGVGWASGIRDRWQNQGGSVVDRDWFQKAMSLRRPYLGPPILSRGTGRAIISYAIPLRDPQGGIRAILVGGISLARLSDAVSALGTKEHTVACLIDVRDGGRYIAHPDPSLIMTKVPPGREAEQRAVAGESGTMETADPEGGDLASFAPVPDLPLAVLVSEPLSSAYAPLDSFMLQAVPAVGIVTALAALLGILLAGSVVRPIRRLTTDARELGRGNLDYRTKVRGHGEVGRLAQVFNGMAENLKKVTASRDEFDSEIRERRQAEESLKAALADVERSNRELEQFAYVASHDLQEPLRMVSSYTQLLSQRYADKLDKDAAEFIGYAVDGANRMQRLIQDLLSYSRVTTRGREPERVDAHAALGAALANLQTLIEETGALVVNGDLPTVKADVTQLTQVFQNLIGNAVKFRKAEEPPRVRVEAVPGPDGFHTFSVADNGIGIDPAYFEKIFVIFQRLHGRGEYPGTGIGLALCRRIIERHGGRIWVESAPDRGATFRFTLPGA